MSWSVKNVVSVEPKALASGRLDWITLALTPVASAIGSFSSRPSKSSVSRLIAVFILLSMHLVGTSNAQISFNDQIRPILSKHCGACHGPDESTRAADLRLDLRSAAIADLGGYAAVVPGSADDSELILRVLSEDDPMPPEDHGHRLTDEEIELLRTWIDEGAKYETHWSFVAPIRPPVPSEATDDWCHNEIDAFVLRKARLSGLQPNAQADPYRLIRRVALDLTGLPPTREMADRIANDPSMENYESIVDELLASSSYGEHWASVWLDIARYADTIGYAGDEPRTIWPWRDWLIKALNENQPLDQFTTEILAGDLLPNATKQQRLATAFHRNTLSNSEGGTNDEEFRTIAVKDRISTTLNAWMGLTVRCAECHSHKYDPISQHEYYQFLAYFNQTADADRPNDTPTLATYPDGREKQLAALDAQLAELNKKLTAAIEARDSSDSKDKEASDETQQKSEEPSKEDAEVEKLKKQIEQVTARRNAPVNVPVMQELAADKQRKTHVMKRGNFQSLGDEVTAAVPVSFHALPDDAPANRLGVAMWLFAEDNPLTARVAVNRYWSRLFGRGIVETEEDFGTQGTSPSHPELLDWLAVELQEDEWDVKALLKRIVMSSTYRQSAKVSQEQLEKDPRNIFLTRGPRNRLTAETLRDQSLAVSGLLSSKMYGPPVYPPNPIKSVTNAFKGAVHWNTSTGEDRYRRAIYTYLKRSQPHPLFETFDTNTRDVCSMRRIPTNTPLQSFMTLNDEAFVEAAQAMASRMYGAGESPETQTPRQSASSAFINSNGNADVAEDRREQIIIGLETALVRPAEEDQVEVLLRLFESVRSDYQEKPELAASMAGEYGKDKSSEQQIELAALTVVANVILNLDEFLTK